MILMAACPKTGECLSGPLEACQEVSSFASVEFLAQINDETKKKVQKRPYLNNKIHSLPGGGPGGKRIGGGPIIRGGRPGGGPGGPGGRPGGGPGGNLMGGGGTPGLNGLKIIGGRPGGGPGGKL